VGDVRASSALVPPVRDRLDVMVAGDSRAAVIAGVTGGALLVGFPPHKVDAGLAPTSWLLLQIAAASLLLSSLVDWYVILPRMSGMLGLRPCRDPERDFPRFPQTWREVTRWWYVHRIAAAVILRYGLAFAAGLTLKHQISIPGGSDIVGAAVAGFLATYVLALPLAAWEAGHPVLMVGRTVRRSELKREPRTLVLRGLRIRLPGRRRIVKDVLGPREYVYDVAVEGVQLVQAAKYESEPREKSVPVIFERDPEKISLREVRASKPSPAEMRFSGCDGRCSGINWYCIENPRCFYNK
jgi:hypothetical protein